MQNNHDSSCCALYQHPVKIFSKLMKPCRALRTSHRYSAGPMPPAVNISRKSPTHCTSTLHLEMRYHDIWDIYYDMCFTANEHAATIPKSPYKKSPLFVCRGSNLWAAPPAKLGYITSNGLYRGLPTDGIIIFSRWLNVGRIAIGEEVDATDCPQWTEVIAIYVISNSSTNGRLHYKLQLPLRGCRTQQMCSGATEQITNYNIQERTRRYNIHGAHAGGVILRHLTTDLMTRCRQRQCISSRIAI